MDVKRLPSGAHETKTNKLRLFSRRARTGILSVSAAALACFVLIPFLLNRLDSANGTSAAVMRSNAPTPLPTPEPSYYVNAIGTADRTPTPQPSAEVHISQYSQLQLNDDFPTVQKLQVRLMELGYLDGDEPSTLYGAATASAVSLFQRTLNYEMNGVADPQLQEYLFSDSAASYEMKLGDSGSDVKSMQSRLFELGYFEDKISGFFGAATEDAVRAFQKKNQLSQDGVFNVDDRELLFSPAARPLIDPTPTPSPTPRVTPKPTKRPSGGSSSGSSSSGGSSSGSSGSGSSSGSSSSSSSSSDSSSGGGSYSGSYSPDGLVSVARAQEGKPYQWSEEGPNAFDCSGLVYFSLEACGVNVSRYSAAGFSQVDRWARIDSTDGLQKGDLVFFRNDSSDRISHTGIYIGSGRFVHASYSSGKVIVSSISTAYWSRNFMLGRRVF